MQNARAVTSCPRESVTRCVLVAEAKIRDDLAVPLDVGSLEIREKPAPFAYHLQEAAATVVVLTVKAKVIREVVDAFGKNRNLNLRGAGIAVMRPVLLNRWCFVECHCW